MTIFVKKMFRLFNSRVIKGRHFHKVSFMESILHEIIDKKRIEIGPFL